MCSLTTKGEKARSNSVRSGITPHLYLPVRGGHFVAL